MTQPDKKYKIGQTIFVLSNKTQKIIPCIVVEETIVKTLSGEKVNWKISIGPGEKKKTVEIDKVDGEIYTSLEVVKEIMFKRMKTFIESLTAEAEQKMKAWYGLSLIEPENIKEDIDIAVEEKIQIYNSPVLITEDDNFDSIELPDGRKAKVNIKGIETV